MADSASAATIAHRLPVEIIQLIISKLPYPTIYRLVLEGNAIATRYLRYEGKRIITRLEKLIHPESGRSYNIHFNPPKVEGKIKYNIVFFLF